MLYVYFGANIVPAMLLAILLHIVNTLLFFKLCSFIFKDKKWVPLVCTLLFALSSVYYEVLHWFTVINTALSLFFLLITLLYLHRFFETKIRKYYFISIISSFFIPMNFSLGILGIAFIVLYYFGILKGSFSLRTLKEDLILLAPYLVVWLLFLVIYYLLVYLPLARLNIAKNFAINLSPQVALRFIVLGLVGTITKSLALHILSHSLALLLGIILLLVLLFFTFLLILYFILNSNRERIRLLEDRGVALFAIGGALLSYGILAVARSFVEADALLNWGRYHYFPYFFICILIGAFLPSFAKVLEKFFNPRRLKIFGIVILVIFLAIQLITIRHKAFSLIRTEGILIKDSSSV